MKKKVSIGLMALICCAAMQAQTRTVEMQCPDVNDNPRFGPSYEIPTVNYD